MGNTIQFLKEALLGEDPNHIEALWQKLYRRFTYLGSRGMATTVISGINIALWDIKGKVLGRPVYDLLGGPVRDSVPTYANGWFTGCQTPQDYARAAKQTIAKGYTALKMDPFLEMRPFHTAYMSGNISAQGEQLGIDITAAVREAVGPHVEVLIDCHGHYNVPTAVRLAHRLAEYKIGWFEEPVPPESYAALQQVRNEVPVPICVGERLFTRFDFLPVFEGRLADYIMPDVLWTGGISELRKIAAMAEAYYVPLSPHNAMGPIQIIAGAQVAMTVPNFYRLEHSVAAIPAGNKIISPGLDIRQGNLYLPNQPGLGIEVDEEYLKKRPATPWSSH